VVSPSNLLYVARFEFGNLSDEGIIDVIKPSGELVQSIGIPNCPEITGLTFSKYTNFFKLSRLKSSILYVTENST